MLTPESPPKSVAIIGSGMAGLVCAYLLTNDRRRRFNVEIFEMQDQLSLDSASYALPTNSDRNENIERVDLPMRAFAGGYYGNLKRMYEYLNIDFTSPQFIYPVSRVPENKEDPVVPYFIHSSNNHMIPPVRPEGCSLLSWVWEVGYLLLCYTWFTLCCFFVPPQMTPAGEGESFGAYLRRIRLPQYYTRKYLLPLASSVTTCPHKDVLAFPASDIVGYERMTYRQPHYTVIGGVRQVQKKLSRQQRVRHGAKVTEVKGAGEKVRVTWTDSRDQSSHSETFDYAILAVTPNVVGAIFQPLRNAMAKIPTLGVETVVHYDFTKLKQCSDFVKRQVGVERFQPSSGPRKEQVMHICSDSTRTESVHEHPSSALVTTYPVSPIDPKKVAHRAHLVRVLRTPMSREVVNRIFDMSPPGDEKHWRNGDDNVFLIGGWCWDGMVLLEGCIVSAMRVANMLGVEVPW